MKKLISLLALSTFIQIANAQCTVTPITSQTNITCFGNNNGAASVSMPTAGYNYLWSNAATSSSITNLAPGNYSVAITSQSCMVSATELVVNGDFSAGNVGFISAYTWKTPPNTAAGQYWVAPGANNSAWNGAFANFPDHTTNTNAGNFMKVNGASAINTNVWCETIAVTPNTNYNFSAWITSLYPISPAQLQFYINGNPIGATFTVSAVVGLWTQFFAVWNSGANVNANICVVNQNTAAGGNDFGLDDISFKSCTTCTYTANFTIAQPPALTLTPSAINGNCAQAYGSLNANVSGGTAPYSYSWTPGGYTTANPTVATAGVYSVTVTDANGCTKTANTSVAILTTPTAVASANGPVCVNGQIQLNAGGGSTYAWTGPNGFSSSQQNPSFTASTTAASGVYSVMITVGTCSSSASVSVGVNSLPSASITAPSTLCSNTVLELRGSGGYNYTWAGPNGFSHFGASPNVSLPSSGMYSLTVSDLHGCSAKTTKSITVNPSPDNTILAGNKKGCAPLCVTFSCNATTDDKVYWTLDNNSSGSTKVVKNCYSMSGKYNIELFITNKYGCSNSGKDEVEVFPKPVADFNYSPLKPIQNTSDVTFTDATYGARIIAWEWYFKGASKAFANAPTANMTYPEAGQYPIALVVTSEHGCIDTVIKTIIVGEDWGIYVPNVFSPDGDGLNDVFQPKGTGIAKYELKIFDRWGEMLMMSDDFQKGWDGYHKGKLCKQDTYVWKIHLTNIEGKSQDLTGHVTLLKEE